MTDHAKHKWKTVWSTGGPDGPPEAIEVCAECGCENVDGADEFPCEEEE